MVPLMGGLATKKSVLDPAKTTRMHHTISSHKSFALEDSWVLSQ